MAAADFDVDLKDRTERNIVKSYFPANPCDAIKATTEAFDRHYSILEISAHSSQNLLLKRYLRNDLLGKFTLCVPSMLEEKVVLDCYTYVVFPLPFDVARRARQPHKVLRFIPLIISNPCLTV